MVSHDLHRLLGGGTDLDQGNRSAGKQRVVGSLVDHQDSADALWWNRIVLAVVW